METKYVRVPFEVELAKKITNGEEEGRIVTDDERSARIVCWDRKDNYYPIIALIEKSHGCEEISYFTVNGMYYRDKESCYDLMLKVPEYMTFKDGDMITCDECETILIAEGNPYKDKAGTIYIDCYAVVISGYFYVDSTVIINSPRLATEEEKQKLIDALKSSKNPRAKKYLKRFFGIEEEEIIEAEIKEEKSEYKFKPFDKVLVRDGVGDYWQCSLFSNYIVHEYRYLTVSGMYKQCLPYNEQTAHLLGTTESPESLSEQE